MKVSTYLGVLKISFTEYRGAVMSVPALAELTAWAASPSDAPLAILYGEKGSGKTVISQRVVHDLRQASISQALRWTPHYFSLKHTEFAAGPVPTLPEILTESVRRHWMTEAFPLPTGESLLAAAQAQPTLFVIDGFEWLLNRWAELPQKRTLMRELLKLVPVQSASGEWSGPYAGAHAKVLLTLRPWYEFLLREQLTLQHRYTELELR